MDRISNLPEGIVIQILSFLSIEEAASTSILSKRWRDMFFFIPNLIFTLTKPRKRIGFTVHRQHFWEFVDRVLTVSGNSTIDSFTINCYVEPDLLKRWLTNLLNRGVLELEIIVPDIDVSVIFECKTLVKLKLIRFRISMLLEDASFPSLKSLTLSRGRFGNVEAFQKLISACSSLEELIIDQFKGEYWEFHILSSLTLKRLKVFVSNSWMSERVSIDLPNLVYLEYTDHVHRQYPVVNLDSLVEAKLNIVMTEPDDCDLSNLIKGLRNVRILHLLTPATVQIFGTFSEAMPVFKNLFQLSVSLHLCSPGSYVLCLDSLLKKSPQLHTLIIEGPLCLNDYECDCKCFLECTHLSSCPVKVLELTVYEGTIKELEQMKHLLEELSCLELVKVRAFANDDKEKLRITTDLQTLPRASSKCEIQVEFS